MPTWLDTNVVLCFFCQTKRYFEGRVNHESIDFGNRTNTWRNCVMSCAKPCNFVLGPESQVPRMVDCRSTTGETINAHKKNDFCHPSYEFRLHRWLSSCLLQIGQHASYCWTLYPTRKKGGLSRKRSRSVEHGFWPGQRGSSCFTLKQSSTESVGLSAF